jgi:hypothetical protein
MGRAKRKKKKEEIPRWAKRFPPVLPKWESSALAVWETKAQGKLDELLTVHAKVARTGERKRGRRYFTEQLNGLLIVALAAKFQAFCRDLHTEAVQHLVADLPEHLKVITSIWLSRKRQLDRGSADADCIKSDFGQLLSVPSFWGSVQERERWSGEVVSLKKRLKRMHEFRHGVAHEDREKFPTKGKGPVLNDFLRARNCCLRLAPLLNEAVMQALANAVSQQPKVP